MWHCIDVDGNFFRLEPKSAQGQYINVCWAGGHMTRVAMYDDKYNNSMWTVETNAMKQEVQAFRLPLDRPFRLRPVHDSTNVLECWCYKHNGCEMCISNHLGDSSVFTVVDFDGTWFRLQPKHAPECTINCLEGKH